MDSTLLVTEIIKKNFKNSVENYILNLHKTYSLRLKLKTFIPAKLHNFTSID